MAWLISFLKPIFNESFKQEEKVEILNDILSISTFRYFSMIFLDEI